jgi:thymidylate synthase ThyX
MDTLPDSLPDVKLVDVTDVPYDLSIATARTCYSSRGIISPEDVSKTPESRALRDRIARSTLQAGHLTTRQHVHFVFAIDNVSRHLVWSFLHSHPFYNSEQVSQRYVEVKPDKFHIPASLRTNARLLPLYVDAVKYAVGVYQELLADLDAPAAAEFYKIFPARRSKPDVWKKNIHKKSMEAARYVLPVGMFTYFYHTINGLTLHRYRRLCLANDVPEETRALVESMFAAAVQADPLFAGEMPDPVPLKDTLEYKYFQSVHGQDQERLSRDFVREFDHDLDGRTSKLVSFDANAAAVLAGAVRAVLGAGKEQLSNQAAVDLVLDPAKNPHLANALNETTLSRTSRAMMNVHYTFAKKISHTADSQDQRHRMVPGSRPALMKQFTGSPDYIVPAIIEEHAPSLEKIQTCHGLAF